MRLLALLFFLRPQGRQFPVQVMYTSAPEDSYVDAAITAALQVVIVAAALSC